MTKEKAKRASNLLYKLEDVETVIDKIMHIEELPQDLYQELIDFDKKKGYADAAIYNEILKVKYEYETSNDLEAYLNSLIKIKNDNLSNSLVTSVMALQAEAILGQKSMLEALAICEKLGGHEDVWYATNIEICDYVTAYDRLETSVDKSKVYNPSTVDVWFGHKNQVYCVKAGETLCL